jgi:hypothetical protein
VLARFLQLQRRTVQARSADGAFGVVDSVEAGGVTHTAFDEATERNCHVTAPLSELLSGGKETSFTIPGGTDEQDLAGPDGQVVGRLVRRQEELRGVLRLSAERRPGPYGALRLQVVLENRTEPAGPLTRRADGLPFALVAAHSLITVPGGRFLSMTEPPEWAAAEVSACVNTGTWPVLGGPEGCLELMLSSPVILYDHPEIAAESAGPLFDSTEIDEILTLRTLTLTETEKQEARSTDPRAADLMDRLDQLPPEMLERMHGAIRYLRPAGGPAAGGAAAAGDAQPDQVPEFRELAGHGDPAVAGQAPWWDPGQDRSVSPETDHVVIAGVRVARGSKVRMRPGQRRADAQDLFLAGRTALVEAVLFDVDGNAHLAVLPEDDPAAELHGAHGRFLYFAPDEVEPIGAS